MKEIKLTMGRVALVDDDDYDHLIKFKWRTHKKNKNCYAINSPVGFMHRVIMKISDLKIQVDHRDHNGLNNQKSNLRACTQSQNMCNQRKFVAPGAATKYIGVSKHRKSDTQIYWHAYITINRKTMHVGSFPFTKDGEIAAAKARDKAALKYHGEFANLNFPTK